MENYNPFAELDRKLNTIIEQNNEILNYIRSKTPILKKSEEWMNINQLIEYLPSKPKQATVYQWTHRNAIPHHKRNNKTLAFKKSEIDEWLLRDIPLINE